MENKVIVNLETYEKLLTENVKLKYEIEELKKQNEKIENYINEMKNYILNGIFNNEYYFKHYSLESLLNHTEYPFNSNYTRCLKLGFTLKEIQDYVKETYNNIKNQKEEE